MQVPGITNKHDWQLYAGSSCFIALHIAHDMKYKVTLKAISKRLRA